MRMVLERRVLICPLLMPLEFHQHIFVDTPLTSADQVPLPNPGPVPGYSIGFCLYFTLCLLSLVLQCPLFLSDPCSLGSCLPCVESIQLPAIILRSSKLDLVECHLLLWFRIFGRVLSLPCLDYRHPDADQPCPSKTFLLAKSFSSMEKLFDTSMLWRICGPLKIELYTCFLSQTKYSKESLYRTYITGRVGRQTSTPPHVPIRDRYHWPKSTVDDPDTPWLVSTTGALVEIDDISLDVSSESVCGVTFEFHGSRPFLKLIHPPSDLHTALVGEPRAASREVLRKRR
ncbi:hypothetical protein Tco_1044365 [Tanacetum coccineum]|uniref:Uncharacterized protein n=1 Tax=Tanacetum coccineum TaxID=301880 RepID=A0ABQ5GQV8_9ASTR